MGFEELWDGFDKICDKTGAGEEFTRSIIKYLEKRHEIEAKYAKGLNHLAPIFAADREDGTIQNAWFSLRDETAQLSADRTAFCNDLQKLIDDMKAQLVSDKKNRGELLTKGKRLVKDLDAVQEIHKQARLKYVDARKKQQKSDENFKKVKAQGGNIAKPEKTLKKDKDKANTADHEYRKKVVQYANAQDKFHLEDMPSLLKEFEAFERARLNATRKHFIHFTSLQAVLGPTTTTATEKIKKSAEAVDAKADLDLYVQKNRPTSDQPPPRAQYMSWDGTVVEDVGPPRAKPGKATSGGTSPAAVSQPTKAVSQPAVTQPVAQPVETRVETPVVAAEPVPTQAAIVTSDYQAKTMWAMYAYDATEEGELTFEEGAKILVLAENESGWWRGRLENGTEGLFPSNFMSATPVEPDTPDSEPEEQPVVQNSTPAVTNNDHTPPVETAATSTDAAPAEGESRTVQVNKYFVAMYDYDAEDDTEMTIKEGDVLFVITETDGWYFGTNPTGQQGTFPSNFCEEKKD